LTLCAASPLASLPEQRSRLSAPADGADISAQRLVESWKDATGRPAYCAPPDLKGSEIMSAFEEFLRDNPTVADRPYGEAMAGTLKKAFPCNGQGT
jgi:hypothetical protein